MRRSLTGRADLVDALSSGLVADPEMAALLGFDQIQRLPDRSEMVEGESLPAAKPTAEVRLDLPDSRLPRNPVPFLRAKRFELVGPVDRMDQFPDEDAASANESTTDPSMRRPGSPEARPAEFAPLGTFTEVFTRLRGQAVLKRPGRQPDLRRIVEELSQCRELHRVPLLSRESWRGDLHVVLDLTRRLVPFRQDQRFISDRLKKYLAQGVATVSVLREGHEQPVVQWPEAREGEWLEPNPDSTILALSDLGAAQLPGGLARWSWLRMGRRWRAVPCRLLALVPCRVDRIPADLLELWEPVAWERGSWRRPTPTDTETEDALELLIGLTSRAVRVEPELLRAIRRLFARGARDPGLEALFWQSADLTNHCSAASFREETLREYRKRFPGDQAEYAELERRAFALIKGTHAPMYAGIWATEMLNLGAEARSLASKEERMQAREWYEAIEKAPDDDLRGEFFRRASSQLSRQAYGAHPTLNRLVKRWIPEPERPDGFDASTADSDREERVCHLYQSHDQLTATVASEESKQPGSWLGALRFRDGHLKVLTLDELPDWVDRTGSDEFGLWVEFSVSGVTQRMRWMPAGTFEMGSPEDDSEAYSDEKPRHKVPLSRGFWLFDTPCTQALWEAVIGENPSHFEGPQRPVENVSWEDCQTFMERLNRELPGIELGLPTEAQWEYACRAGKTEPRYHPDLDAIAWYDKNSSSTTHDVGGKLPNPWGLYDMLGNVDEWCRDPWRSDYNQEAPVDSKATVRVVRGGSWNGDPRYVRAAFRVGVGPGRRDELLGFRCSSSAAGGLLARRERGAGAELHRRAGAGGGSAAESDERGLQLAGTSTASVILPSVSRALVVADREALTLEWLDRRPAWASAMGRDRYGLWATFTLEGDKGKEIEQKLRWISPGRFRMGSPEDEEGRYPDDGLHHEELVSGGFWMFETPCTQALWTSVMGDNPSRFKGAARPVETVTWNQCREFAEKLSGLVGLEMGLPTEVHWEYACRAGTRGARYGELDRIAWFYQNSGEQTHDVGLKQPNAWGLYDMLGNVLEWCGDLWRSDSIQEGPTNYEAPGHVVRGGSWNGAPRNVRASYRGWSSIATRDAVLGFRCSSSVVSEFESKQERAPRRVTSAGPGTE